MKIKHIKWMLAGVAWILIILAKGRVSGKASHVVTPVTTFVAESILKTTVQIKPYVHFEKLGRKDGRSVMKAKIMLCHKASEPWWGGRVRWFLGSTTTGGRC